MADTTPIPPPGKTAPAPAMPEVRGASWQARVLKWLVVVITTVVAAVALYLVFAVKYTYSTGERAGFVQKFSSKGWVCKTWEGELATVTLPGALPERFVFSVRDEAVARQVSDTMGERVVLAYEEHLGLPSCFGETNYFVTSIRRRNEGVVAPAPPPQPTPSTPVPPPAQ
jgi:hypothetical protein